MANQGTGAGLPLMKESRMFKKISVWGVVVAAVFMLLAYYFVAAKVNYSITVNGEEIHGLQEVVLAAGGVLAAGFAVLWGLALVALILAGTSMVLLGMFAICFLGVLFIFSPVLMPVAGCAIVIALIVRKRKDTISSHDAE